MDHYLFLLKKFLGNLLMPVPVTLLLLLWALLLLLRRKTRWLGIIVVLLATALLFVASYAPLSNQYIAPFETRIPSYQKDQTPVDYIAVLGHWHQSVADQPVTSELSSTAIVRLAEGIRIYRLNPGSQLIFTGFKGIGKDPVSYPEKLRELAIALGVPATDILIFNGPRDTMEEAEVIAENVPEASLVVVTTAVHMPRALDLFHRAGLDPIPAPTEHLSKPFKSWWTFPTGKTLEHSEYWAHERLGLLWVKLTGQVKEYFDKD
ncbi:ElyC/SanA/YdcF family protein [uncultured Desulfuromusa sp.]|uniref:ElyC/SanA/YdcF family protein n=1 Tax=uncultured Desulfuromusa sp. TaxID=219183 RepID=UPI002AA700C5|nr:ElyC/SanA/YdcF family protein [uncultured Desulfuromusa sp.]